MCACVRACVRACLYVVLAVCGSVHRMVRNLGDVMLEQECSVLGASDGPECARFNRSGQRYACVLANLRGEQRDALRKSPAVVLT